MRYLAIRFECDGNGYTEEGIPWRCDAAIYHDVEVTVGPRGELEIDDSSMPEGWSNRLESQRYDYIGESKARNTVACPKCKVEC